MASPGNPLPDPAGGNESGWDDLWNLNPVLGGGEFPGAGGGPFAGGRFLRRKKRRVLELLGSGLGQPVPLVYGRSLFGGNAILQNRAKPESLSDKAISLFIALCEGEAEGPEVVWLNDKRVNTSDTTKYHFHPGLDGEAGGESDPATRNQKVCSFFPSTFRPRLHFSRTAYAALKIPRDPKHPKKTREFEVFGVYRGLRVRQFDNAGTQTAYAWSANPAWCALDLLIRRYLKPHGLINEALTTAEKARLDFQAWKDWADYCDALITAPDGSSVARFECHVALDQELDLMRALDLILTTGRAYLLERNGKLAPFADKARSSLLILGANDVQGGTLELVRRPLRDTPNLFRFTCRDLDSGRGLGSISSSAKTVTGVDTAFTAFFERDGVIDLRSGAQKGERRRIVSIESDTSLTLASGFSVNQSAGTAYGNPAKDFEERVRESVNEDLQDQMGRIQEAEADLGAQTLERAERLAEYLRRSVTDRVRSARFTILSGVSGALDLLPGDVVTAPADLEFLTSRDYEVMEITDNPDGSRAVEALEYVASVFIDSAGPQPQPGDAPDLSGAFNENAPQVDNILNNASFYYPGVAGQEGTANAKQWTQYSNAGGAPANPTDVDWVDARDAYLIKSSTSTVDKIGIRTLWNNLGKLLKPGQPITVAVALRHAGSSDAYDKDVKVKLDSSAETYTDADGGKYVFTIPAGSIRNQFEVFFGTFELRDDQQVPDALNAFVWSEATAAAKSNFDLEVDWVTLAAGRFWVHVQQGGGPGFSVTWNAGAGLYDINNIGGRTIPTSDVGGAGEASGGAGTVDHGGIAL